MNSARTELNALHVLYGLLSQQSYDSGSFVVPIYR